MVHASPGYEEMDPSEIVKLDFTLPRDVDNRFVRPVEIFGLSVVDCSTDTLTIGSSIANFEEDSASEKEYESSDQEKDEKRTKVTTPSREVKPGWKLWLRSWEEA